MRLFANANYKFVEYRKVYFAISIILILAGIVSMVIKGGPKFGIDFKGGTLLQIQFADEPNVHKVRAAFEEDKSLGSVEIKAYGDKKDRELIIGIEKLEISPDAVIQKVKDVLESGFAGKYQIRREESVGPKIGNELKTKALIALFLSWLSIIVYLWIRFQFKFGVTAVAGLIHDVLIVLGACSIFNIEWSMTLVAAFLTIIGYSINDTIIVFDRVRENLFVDKRMDIYALFNHSINQTLSRTIITSGLTFLAVVSLYAIGVSAIQDFAFAMIVGIITGTYSSFGISLSLIALWNPETLRHKKMA
ncbi:MAG: protein translocase subunit SecF [Fibrobacterota bacterium]